MTRSTTTGLAVAMSAAGGVLAASLLLHGCASDRREAAAPAREAPGPMALERAMGLLEDRPEWGALPALSVARHPAEKYLAGMVIVIDPGHGGTDGGDLDPRPTYKAGPTGVKEAHVNLRVSLLLERLLRDAGAEVILTRRGDDTLSLSERAAVANVAPRPDGGKGADLFLSVHHNASSNPATNYSSVWYHGQANDAEPELDVARAIGHALGRHLRTDVGVTSPLLSDQLMYPAGFAVLRASRVPSVLLEISFFSNAAEEQRLRDAGYNLRAAYAIYEGLCEYAYGGRPTQTTPAVEVLAREGAVAVTTTLDEGLPPWWGKERPRILRSTIDASLDGQPGQLRYDEGGKRLTALFAIPSGASAGGESEHVLELHHANLFKHHNFPQRYAVVLGPDGGGKLVGKSVTALPPVRATTRPATAPAGG